MPVLWTSRSPGEIGSHGRVSYGKTYVDVSVLMGFAIHGRTVYASARYSAATV